MKNCFFIERNRFKIHSNHVYVVKKESFKGLSINQIDFNFYITNSREKNQIKFIPYSISFTLVDFFLVGKTVEFSIFKLFIDFSSFRKTQNGIK